MLQTPEQVPLQHTEICGVAEVHRQPVKNIPEAKGCALVEAADHGNPLQEQTPGQNCSPWRGTQHEQVFWQELWSCEGPTLEQPVPRSIVSSWKRSLETARGNPLCNRVKTWEGHDTVGYNSFLSTSSVNHLHSPSFLLKQDTVFQQAEGCRQWKQKKSKHNFWAKSSQRRVAVSQHLLYCLWQTDLMKPKAELAATFLE